MKSPGFSSFRTLMDLWDDAADLDRKVKSILEGPNFSFYFTDGDSVFGGSETARMTFAQMKKPDKDLPTGWADEASFMAINLSKMVHGEMGQEIFSKKDLSRLHVVDYDQAYEKLRKQVKKHKKSNQIAIVGDKSGTLQSEE